MLNHYGIASRYHTLSQRRREAFPRARTELAIIFEAAPCRITDISETGELFGSGNFGANPIFRATETRVSRGSLAKPRELEDYSRTAKSDLRGTAWRAATDDDEHYVYAIAL